MINLSKLLAEDSPDFPGDGIRFGRAQFPVVVWHITERCNLHCRHCYSSSGDSLNPGEAGRDEAVSFLRSLAEMKPPTLLMSGGEPLAHPNFFLYLEMGRNLGINVSISTNGTLVDEDAARRMAASGVSYVGVSIDGAGEDNDVFRGRMGAFRDAKRGIEFLAANGCRVGLRVTLASPVLKNLDSLFLLALELPVSRICFYHFMPSGRGASDATLLPSLADERRATASIISWADEVCATRAAPDGRTWRGGKNIEILTVGDASDGVLAYKYLLERDEARAERARILLTRSAAKKTGKLPGILSVRWDGTVFRNQFSWDSPIGSWGNVISDLCVETTDSPLALRNPDCTFCDWLEICSGCLRSVCIGR
ncbi:MAG: radical SAM protein [Synergistaceae bacterium]|jgi:MoaA/NifB/PqqE/SkfB family radical SAM enzyme|nr:radical SAM protein [Synergistaceae bacterium]